MHLPLFISPIFVRRPLHTPTAPLNLQQLGEFETLQVEAKEFRRVRLYNLLDSTTPFDDICTFESVWDMQRELVQDHIDRLSSTQTPLQFISNTTAYNNKGVDSVLFIQHEPVYTLGTGSSDANFIKQTDDKHTHQHTPAVKVVRIERGGEVTYHGPGQLVIYPILDLRAYKMDVHWYLRALEQCILLALDKCGIKAQREDSLTGIWVDGRKVAAVGIKVRRWITMHGVAINVEKSSLDPFRGIVPCGLVGRDVCCINDFLQRPVTVQEFAFHMIQAMEEIFSIQLYSK